MSETSLLDPLPSIELAQACEKYSSTKDIGVENFLLNEIKENRMCPYYRYICKRFEWNIDQNLESQLEESNQTEFQNLQSALVDARENQSEEDVRLAQQNLAIFFLRIGDKPNANKFLTELFNVTIALGQKIDVVFCQIRLSFFASQLDEIPELLDSAKKLVQEGGDWERKNRLQVYEGLYFAMKKSFLQASSLFIGILSTFTATELLPFEEFVYRVVILATLSLTRSEFQAKIDKSPEVRASSDKVQRVLTLYRLDYRKFFDSLSEIQENLKTDIWFGRHISFLIKELRVRAYRQFLKPFEAVQIQNMAETFGVTDEFIETEMRRFIFCRKIDAKIDKVHGNIHTNPPDSRAAMMRETLKRGEALIIRLQKLSRILSS